MGNESNLVLIIALAPEANDVFPIFYKKKYLLESTRGL